MTTSAHDVHRRAIIVDGHCDTPYRLLRHELRLSDSDPQAQVDLRSLVESGITASFFVSYVPPHYAGRGAAAFAHRLIDLIHAQVNLYGQSLALVVDRAGIEQAKRKEKVAVMIGVEGGHAIENSLDILRRFFERGARYMTLTHVNTNDWCDSSGDAPRHGGLTSFGREVVRTMNDIGMVVDVSHISDGAFFHVLDTSRTAVVASHSSCRALCRHPRNLTDEMLRTLAHNGGICMINFFSAFIDDRIAAMLLQAPKRSKSEEGSESEELPDDRLDWDSFLHWYESLGCPTATIDQVVDHIIHAATVAGVDHVGIGSDFDGVPALPAGLTNASLLPGVTARLLDRGVAEVDVAKILGGNFLRVLGQVEGDKREA